MGTWGVRYALVLACAGVAASCSTTRDQVRDEAQQSFASADGTALVVVTDLPSPGFWSGDGTDPAGLEHELAQLLADRFGLTLRIVDAPFTDIVAGRLGDADLAISQISIDDDRAEVIDFSVPYHVTDSAVIGAAGDELTDLKTARELRWAVETGTTQAEVIVADVRPQQAPRQVESAVEAAQAVLDGDADVALVDLPSAFAAARRLDPAGSSLAVIASIDTDERYAVALPADAPSGNLRAVDAAIRALTADGTLDDLVEEWLLPLYEPDPDDLPVIRIR